MSQTKELLSSWNLGPGTVACGSALVPQPEGSSRPHPSFGVFMEALLHRHDRLNHWLFVIDVIDSSISPFPLPGAQEVGLKVTLVTH